MMIGEVAYSSRMVYFFFFGQHTVGLAIIGGLIAWLNRRGGCASRRKNRQPDMEDFGLAESDFPHHRSPGMAAAAAMSGTASVSNASHPSPTMPRMTEMNNGAAGAVGAAGAAGYYAMPTDYDSGRHYAPYDDYSNQAYHQNYYYPEPAQQGAYEERYYYENQQQQQQQAPVSAVLPPAGHATYDQQYSPVDHQKPDERY
ncbi:hypothetical protein BC940DRAFT_46205 [Gongronella butleri]|nr:hypothetical protein BC940DRAFT_46205 [Gongronella butleri]